MMGPSSAPRPEHAPRPGVTWDTVLVRVETVVDDGDPESTTATGFNDPTPPRLNRATRRAIQRAARRKR